MSKDRQKIGGPKLSGGAGVFDIRDLIRKAQNAKSEREDTALEENSEVKELTSIEAVDKELGSSEQRCELLRDGPVGELDEDETSSDSIPLPRRKTEYEKYMKAKEREQQIRKYNEKFIQESREERAKLRAKVRQRTTSDDEEPTPDSSPTKKVRFKV